MTGSWRSAAQVRLFEHMVGPDARDPLTVGLAAGPPPPANYTQFLDGGALQGARIGVLRSVSDVPFADPEVSEIYERCENPSTLEHRCCVKRVVWPVTWTAPRSVLPVARSDLRSDVRILQYYNCQRAAGSRDRSTGARVWWRCPVVSCRWRCGEM